MDRVMPTIWARTAGPARVVAAAIATALLLMMTLAVPAGAQDPGYDFQVNFRIDNVIPGHIIRVVPEKPSCLRLPDSREVTMGDRPFEVLNFNVRVRTDGDCFWAQAKGTFQIVVLAPVSDAVSTVEAELTFSFGQGGPHYFHSVCDTASRAKCRGDGGFNSVNNQVWITYSS